MNTHIHIARGVVFTYADAAKWPRDVPYPHAGGCPGCFNEKLCFVCGGGLDANRCANGCCGACHRAHCTSSGDSAHGDPTADTEKS